MNKQCCLNQIYIYRKKIKVVEWNKRYCTSCWSCNYKCPTKRYYRLITCPWTYRIDKKLNHSNLFFHFSHVFELVEREKNIFQIGNSVIVEMVNRYLETLKVQGHDIYLLGPVMCPLINMAALLIHIPLSQINPGKSTRGNILGYTFNNDRNIHIWMFKQWIFTKQIAQCAVVALHLRVSFHSVSNIPTVLPKIDMH